MDKFSQSKYPADLVSQTIFVDDYTKVFGSVLLFNLNILVNDHFKSCISIILPICIVDTTFWS